MLQLHVTFICQISGEINTDKENVDPTVVQKVVPEQQVSLLKDFYSIAFALRRKELGVQRVGQNVSVPDNDVAKLMHYLSCVCNAIDCSWKN